MSLIVSLETSTKVCSIALHRGSQLLAEQTYYLEKSHSSLLPIIIEDILERCDLTMQDLEAVAVASGPGSYTGLRIGVTTAKTLAYSLNIPLVSVITLEAMHLKMHQLFGQGYFCPMIDARRMEVYCTLHDGVDKVWEPTPLIVEADSFEDFQDKPLYLFGDGAEKTKEVLTQSNIHWLKNIHPSAVQVGELALKKVERKEFEDVAYFEPFYLKEFQTKPAKKLV